MKYILFKTIHLHQSSKYNNYTYTVGYFLLYTYGTCSIKYLPVDISSIFNDPNTFKLRKMIIFNTSITWVV